MFTLMQPRQDVVEIFSTFLRLEADRVTGWSTDLRLQRRMSDCLRAATEGQSDRHWALYWHQIWQRQTDPAAAGHLSAYLQETCYWVSQKIALNQRQSGGIADFFQMAIIRVPKLLQHFKPQYSQSLKKYAELVFENSLKDWLRLQQQVEICTDWALLHRLSRKRLLAALQQAGLSPLMIAEYTLAWECFQELATTAQVPLNKMSCPDPKTLQTIAAAYNAARLGQVGATPIASSETIGEWLRICAKSVRQFLKPEVVSADAPRAGQDSGSALDTIIGSDLPPIEVLLKQEEEAAFTQQLAQLHQVLADGFATFSTAEIDLLRGYYCDQLTQVEIASQMGIQQYQVSRQLERIRRSLLKKVAQWSQETLHISPTPSVVDAMSHSLEEWLREHITRKAEG